MSHKENQLRIIFRFLKRSTSLVASRQAGYWRSSDDNGGPSKRVIEADKMRKIQWRYLLMRYESQEEQSYYFVGESWLPSTRSSPIWLADSRRTSNWVIRRLTV